MSIGEYFDKLPDWTLKHFICHVVDASGRSPGGRGWFSDSGWWVVALQVGRIRKGGVSWATGSALGQCVAFRSFIWTLVLFHCQLVSLPRSHCLSHSLFIWVLCYLSLCGHMCVTSKLQAKPNRTDREGPPSGAHHGEWQISKVPMDICNRTERLECGRWLHLKKLCELSTVI